MCVGMFFSLVGWNRKIVRFQVDFLIKIFTAPVPFKKCLDIPGLSSDAIRLADDLSQQIANDLHEYYTYGMRLPNYANRLIKMTKLIDTSKVYSKKYIRILKEKF